MSLLFPTLIVANPVVEKVTLPVNAAFSGEQGFPIRNDLGHHLIARKTGEHVQMIRHEHEQGDIPIEAALSELHRFKNGFRGGRMAELIFAAGDAAKGDKEKGAGLHPAGWDMGEFFSLGEICRRLRHVKKRRTGPVRPT